MVNSLFVWNKKKFINYSIMSQIRNIVNPSKLQMFRPNVYRLPAY